MMVNIGLFDGPGGWAEALRIMGLTAVGIEWDPAACATRAAAGHLTIRADVTQCPARHLRGKVGMLIASPPCTAFSLAGKGEGRAVIDDLASAMRRGDWSAMREHPLTVWAPLDVGRWIEECEPDTVALELVPPALVLWEALAIWLRGHGYSVWAGVLNAADFGVPQTRQRAILMAAKGRPVHPPVPTHARLPVPGLFEERESWVSMAAALGWGAGLRHTHTHTHLAERQRNGSQRKVTEPAMTITGSADNGNFQWHSAATEEPG